MSQERRDYPYVCPDCGANLGQPGAIVVHVNSGYPIGHVEPTTETGVGIALDKIEHDPLSSIGLECANCGQFFDDLAKEVKEIYLDPECEIGEEDDEA